MLNGMIDKVKQFLRDALEVKESGESVRVTGMMDVDGGGWIAEAEVVERSYKLPGHRVFDAQRYAVKLNADQEICGYKQLKDDEKLEEETEV
ncbi:MAG TPA: hypothetical protein VL485_05990 [Ktedonobacteraceae bacterium]|jgi:hypothetical protein|nr:hypothetical protein [Ktedonobacteraceae bacterium]